MRKTVLVRLGLVGVGGALVLVAVSATDASACSRRSQVCGGYAPAPVYQYAPPPPVYHAPPPAYYAPPNVTVVYGYAPSAHGYAPAAGYYGYRNCDRGYGSGYGPGYGYAPPAAYDDGYRPAAGWVPVR